MILCCHYDKVIVPHVLFYKNSNINLFAVPAPQLGLNDYRGKVGEVGSTEALHSLKIYFKN